VDQFDNESCCFQLEFSKKLRETSAFIRVQTFQTQRFLLSTGKISRLGFFQIAQRSASLEIGWKKIHASVRDTHENCQD